MKDGLKMDQGKPMVGLLVHDFAEALLKVAEVTTYGALKYAPSNWKQVPKRRQRYNDALFRHLLSAETGEVTDQESGLPHLAHAAWNLLALLQMQLTESAGRPMEHPPEYTDFTPARIEALKRSLDQAYVAETSQN